MGIKDVRLSLTDNYRGHCEIKKFLDSLGFRRGSTNLIILNSNSMVGADYNYKNASVASFMDIESGKIYVTVKEFSRSLAWVAGNELCRLLGYTLEDRLGVIFNNSLIDIYKVTRIGTTFNLYNNDGIPICTSFDFLFGDCEKTIADIVWAGLKYAVKYNCVNLEGKFNHSLEEKLYTATYGGHKEDIFFDIYDSLYSILKEKANEGVDIM